MISLSRLRADAREIFAAGIESADPFPAVMKFLHLENDSLRAGACTYDLSSVQNIFIAGGGKAAARMALALEASLGGRITGGVIVVKYGHQLQLEKIDVIEAGHPIPDVAGFNGARRIMELARGCRESDLLFFLASGGASALLPCPAEGLSLADKQRTTEVLLKSGASIKEVNAVRKHISQIKGGRLAQMAAPAPLVSLILSDVINDSPEDIASGPTAPDSSTYGDCLNIIRQYDKGRRIPTRVVDLLQRGAKGEITETPKPRDAAFEKVQNIIIASNGSALIAAQQRAQALGYKTLVSSNSLDGESRIVARSHSILVKEILRENRPVSRPACLIAGGETTVTVCGDGLGGRNQEFCLAAAMAIDGLDGVVVLSGGTDGTDGPTDAAGGIVDGTTIARGRAQKIDAGIHLARNDSYHFLQATGDLLLTGPTLTNVMDLQITLIA
jgi:glycerate 2-kinase